MAKASGGGRRIAVTAVVALGWSLAGCGARVGGPAPLVEGGAPPPEPPSSTVTIAPGQTLSRIAVDHHVPMQAIAAANHLSPPYRIIAGSTLIIPGGGTAVAAVPPEPPAPPAALASVGSPPSKPVAVAELPPPKPPAAAPKPEALARRPVASASHPAEAEPVRPIPLDRPPPAAKPEPAAPAKLAALPPAERHLFPPPPAEDKTAVAAPSPPVKDKAAAAPPPPGHDKPVAALPAPKRDSKSPPAHGGSFLWPVRGHVLEGFGSGADGTHNDGINIAAPRGAAVEAADGGVVAYAGNELRGYGNLILVKHPNGWITAYAHCDMMLVKPGQKVAKGQVIARVGATGNVGEPQLHFELRHGNKPVDPREYLTPAPAAEAKEARPG